MLCIAHCSLHVMRCNSAPYKRRATCLQGVLTKELCKIADAAAEIFFFICLLAERCVCICPTKVSWPRERPTSGIGHALTDLLSKQNNAACVWAYARGCIVNFWVRARSLVNVYNMRAAAREMCQNDVQRWQQSESCRS